MAPSVPRCFLFGYILSTIHIINADYTCLCNNDDFKKEILKSVGYIQNDTNIHVSKCVGDPRPEDHVTTVQPYTGALSTKISSNITTVTANTAPPSTNIVTTQGTMQTNEALTTTANIFNNSISFVQDLTTPTPHATIISTPRTYTITATTILSSTSYARKSTNGDKTNTSYAQNVTTVQPYTGTLSTKISSNITTVTANTAPPSTNIVTTQGTMQTNEALTTTANILNNSISFVQGHVELCPNRVQHLAKQPGELIAQLEHSCYEVVQTSVSWSHAESNCRRNGGHLVHIASQQEQDFIYNFLVKHHSHTVWLGLHDKNQEENFEWTSGNTVTYENWKPGRKDIRYHNSEDCVYMIPSTGQWDDIRCGGDNSLSELFQGIRHAYICQYATVHASESDGNINMCPYTLHQQAERDRGVLGQYEHSCYEVVPNTKVAWQHAEDVCHGRGGHLAYISNIQEQAFIQGFLNRYSPGHAVWIGLTDHNSEGKFQWTSGTPVQYTNWVPGHVSNYVSSSQEDCVAFIPYKSGQWDDIPCGSTHHSIFGGTSSSGETHPLLCQYPISAGPSLIG